MTSDETPPPERFVGGAAYERALSEAECRKVERTHERLSGALDGFVYVWVRDARPFAHGKESTVEVFQLRVHPTLPVAEVRDLVEERFELISSYRESNDGPLQLFLNGCILEDGQSMAEYLTLPRHRSQNWATPYAGILWVVPFRPRKGTARNLWVGTE